GGQDRKADRGRRGAPAGHGDHRRAAPLRHRAEPQRHRCAPRARADARHHHQACDGGGAVRAQHARSGGVISTSRIRTMPDFVATHRLTEAASLKMLAAGVAKANELGCKVSLAIVDQSCRLVAFLMMDGARHFSIVTTQRKAITSASQRLPTGYAAEENALSMTVRIGDFTNVPGGFPITVGGEVIGAVAAGGASIE